MQKRNLLHMLYKGYDSRNVFLILWRSSNFAHTHKLSGAGGKGSVPNELNHGMRTAAS